MRTQRPGKVNNFVKPSPPRHSIVFRSEFSSETAQLDIMKLGPCSCTPPSSSQLQRRCPASFFHFQTCRGLRAHPGAARAQRNEGARTFLGSNRRVETTAPIHPRRRRDPSRPFTLRERPDGGGRRGRAHPSDGPLNEINLCSKSAVLPINLA